MIVEEEKNKPEQKQSSVLENPKLKTGYFEEAPDDTVLNRIIQLRSIPNSKSPKGQPGMLYFDKDNNKIKIYIDSTGKWGDVMFTTTSTSTSSSTSTSTTTT